MRNETRIGEIEYSKRIDGKYSVYKFMPDPTAEPLPLSDSPNFKDYSVGRWVQIDVIAELPKAR